MNESRILDLIPADVFKSKELFHEVLKECWEQIGEEKQDDLKRRFLPIEGISSASSQDELVHLFLDGKLGLFDSDPVDRIYFDLKISKFAPDIKQALKEVRTLQQKAQQLKEKEYQMKIWSEISSHRKSLFKSSLNVACDEQIKSIEPVQDWSPSLSLILSKKEAKRIRRNVDGRYLKELQKFTTETEMNFLNSSDEEEDMNKIYESKPTRSEERRLIKMIKMYKKKRKTVSPHECLYPTISLEDVVNRVEGCQVDEVYLEPPTIPAAVKPKIRRKSKQNSLSNKLTLTASSIPVSSTSKLTEKLKDSMGAAIFARKMELNLNKKASVSADVFDFDDDSPSESSSKLSNKDKPQPSSIANQVSQILSSLTSISNNPSRLSSTIPAPTIVYEEPPASFFSLIRNVFQEHAPTDKKLSLHKLEELVKDKLKNLDPKLGWSHDSVQSAMNFLSYYSEPCHTPNSSSTPTPNIESQDSSSSFPGSDMIPLVDYKEKNMQWQWIGGCRDDDDVMKRLNEEWMCEKDRNPSSLSDPSAPVPPPLFPTHWMVKPASQEDQRIYREQEAIRYNNPSKAFTYRVHDYEAVVGPVKGSAVINIGNNPNVSNASTPVIASSSASPNKAREHSLLVGDRPPFVTLLSLVRDAAARLPNGEGTRSDICELLKDSQYLLPTVSDQQINQIVSGALDRLHYEKDPCVKYDTNRKCWIYLHRNRTESDFERLHEMQVAAVKAKRNLTKSRKPSLSIKTSISSPPAVGKSHPKGVQRPSPCKSSDSSSSSNTPILPNPITPTASKITVSPLAPKPVAIIPQPPCVENNVLNMLAKSGQPTYQLAQTNPSYGIKKTCQSNYIQSQNQTNQVLFKAMDNGIKNSEMSPVVSVIPLSSFTPINRVITTSPIVTKEKIRTSYQSSQKVGMVTINNPAAGGGDQVSSRQGVMVNQPVARTMQQPQTSLPPGTQSVSIPSSMLLSGRPGHVVLGGKAYMMATTSGGSIVLHPHNPLPMQGGQMTASNNSSNQLAGVVQPFSVRTLQGIKVIPVPNQFQGTGNNQRVASVVTTLPMTSQNGANQQQFVARLISTRQGQVQSSSQMIIPNTGYQQVILTPSSQSVAMSTVSKQQIVNQIQIQPVNSFQTQIATSQTPQKVNSVKDNTQ